MINNSTDMLVRDFDNQLLVHGHRKFVNQFQFNFKA